MTDQPETGKSEGEMPEEPQTPQAEPEEFDKERAMVTIRKLRERDKEAERLAKKLEAFEKAEQERRQAEMSELEKAQQKATQLESELAGLRLKELQRQAAKTAGIPDELAERLRGATLDELQADAEGLAKLLPKKQPPPVPPTNPGNASGQGETLEERRRRLLG